jgi:hypothetical protein
VSRTRRTAVVIAAATAAAVTAGLNVAPASGAAPQHAAPGPEPVATGLDNPRQLSFSRARSGPDRGALYVAEAGVGGSGVCVPGPEGAPVCFGRSGAVTRVKGGHQRRVVDRLPSLAAEGGGAAIGPSDVHVTPFKRLTVSVGLGADPAVRDVVHGRRLATVLSGKLGRGVREIVDVGDFEVDRNPHPIAVDSNPVALLKRGRSWVVVDAGGNSVVQFFPGGGRKLLTVFEDRTVPAPPGFPVPTIDMQPVPTSIAVGPDGAFYFSQLTGFPFPPGGASIWRLAPGEKVATVYASGLTNVTDLAWHGDHLYAVQIADTGLGAVEEGQLPMGSLRMVTPGGSSHPAVAAGLPAPYGVALRGGSAYVTTCAVCPDAGAVWKLPLG